jgi:hypothetical protein
MVSKMLKIRMKLMPDLQIADIHECWVRGSKSRFCACYKMHLVTVEL